MNTYNDLQYIPQLSIDCVVFGYLNKELKVLISKLNLGIEFYTLPGGFIEQNESIEEAALHILKDRTGLQNIYLDQFRVFGQADRSNQPVIDILQNQKIRDGGKEFELTSENLKWFNKRFLSIGYYALVDINKVKLQKGDFDESLDWVDIEDIPSLMMDHNLILTSGLEALRKNLDQKILGFNLLPETFTMREVKELYEAVYDKPFARNNFQKKILDLGVLERLEKKFTGAANKAPYLYRFRRG